MSMDMLISSDHWFQSTEHFGNKCCIVFASLHWGFTVSEADNYLELMPHNKTAHWSQSCEWVNGCTRMFKVSLSDVKPKCILRWSTHLSKQPGYCLVTNVCSAHVRFLTMLHQNQMYRCLWSYQIRSAIITPLTFTDNERDNNNYLCTLYYEDISINFIKETLVQSILQVGRLSLVSDIRP